MIVFCPNCGTQGSGQPGARATCASCGSSFDIPAEAAHPQSVSPPRVEAPPKPGPGFSPPRPDHQAPPRRTPRGPHPLAIISLVSGIVCCIPLLSPGLAIGCALAALKQIDDSGGAQGGRALAIAGLILGSLTALMQLSVLISSLAKGW
jgi:hypothetical protein